VVENFRPDVKAPLCLDYEPPQDQSAYQAPARFVLSNNEAVVLINQGKIDRGHAVTVGIDDSIVSILG
jgi:hypothetical protein